MTTPECFGCGESIPGGMKILEQYLCPTCEMKLVRVDADQPDYQDWIDHCKRFWEKTEINLKDSED